MSAPDDAELVGRARAADRWALEAIYRRHVHRVTGVVAKMLRYGPDVEDTVQDTFVDAFEQLDQLREPASVGRWLVGIAVHKAHRRFRRRRLLRALGLDRSTDDERLETQAGAVADAEVRLELRRIDAALDRMDAGERTCFVLRNLEGYALAEVAELSGCSLATAKRRIARAEAIVRAVHGGEVDHG